MIVGSRMRSSPFLIGLIAALVWVCGTHAAVSQMIYAYFDQDGNIQFRYADSSNVGSTIPPGTYTINLENNGADDEGNNHIFHLFGPGVDYQAPNVDTVATFTATFQAGATYTAQDTLNPANSETFVATNATPAPTPSPSTPSTGSSAPTSVGIVGSENVPFRGSLDAIVYADGKLSLTHNGNKFPSLKSGKWTFSVDDESKKAGFSIQILHGRAQTISSKAFVGSNAVTVTLKPGRWFYFSPGGKRTTFFVTS